MTTTEPVAAPTATALDQAAWASLTGPHASFALGRGRARRYPADVSPFAAVSATDDPQAWADLAQLYAPGEVAGMAGTPGFTDRLPAGVRVVGVIPGVQLVATDLLWSGPDDEALELGAADAAEALELVARTEPGPFLPRTYELGSYLGIRRDGRLIAMAGERLHPPGWTEISAVCTDPAFRRQGLAARLVRAVAHGIRQRGETPFLHTGAANASAIRLYEAMGFELRRRVEFAALQPSPAAPAS